MIKIPYTNNNVQIKEKLFTETNLKQICQQHQGQNFGIVTGSLNNIIAIKIVIPQLKIGLSFDKGFYVICKENIDPLNVLKCKSEGYIVLKTENIDFESIDFTKYLYGVHILGNMQSVPCHGNSDNEGNIYCGYGEIKNTGRIDIHKFKNAYKQLATRYDVKGKFYSKFVWEDFYKNYFPDLKKIHQQVFANNKICINSSGLFKCEGITGYPSTFLREVLGLKNWRDILLDFCEEIFVFGDNYKIIIEKNNGYYLVKNGKSKRITNWAINRVNYSNSRHRYSIFTTKKDLYLTNKILASFPQTKEAFAKKNLQFFTKSETLIYELIESLIFDDVLHLWHKKKAGPETRFKKKKK